MPILEEWRYIPVRLENAKFRRLVWTSINPDRTGPKKKLRNNFWEAALTRVRIPRLERPLR